MATRAGSIARSVANRGVHIQIIPRPRNITESREILHLLSEFGPVEYFRSLRYDLVPTPHTALAIFKDEHAARHCILKSPIRFQMGTVDASARREAEESFDEPKFSPFSNPSSHTPSRPAHSRGAFDLGQTRSLTTDSLPKPPRTPSFPYGYASNPMQPPEPELEDKEEELAPRLYQMHVNAAKVNFQQRAEMGHYHGGFVNDWRSVPNDDLRKRTPLKGMANLNWRMKTKSATTIRKERAAIDGPFGGLGEIYRAAQKQKAKKG